MLLEEICTMMHLSVAVKDSGVYFPVITNGSWVRKHAGRCRGDSESPLQYAAILELRGRKDGGLMHLGLETHPTYQSIRDV